MSEDRHAFLLLATLLFSLILPAIHFSSQGQGSLYLNWFVYENPSPLDERPFSVCVLGNYIYVVGYDATRINSGYRIEKRLKSTGALVKVWQYNPTVREDILFDCLALNNTIYVIGMEGALTFPSIIDFGKIVVIALDQDLNMLNYHRLNITSFATSITTDGVYIYVGGFYQGNGRGWFIAKFTQELDLVKLALYNQSPLDDYIYQIKFDRLNNVLWIAGLENGMYASVAYVDSNLSYKQPVEILKSKILGSALSIDIDEYGNKYVSIYGSMNNKFVGLIKLDANNNIVATLDRYYGQKVVWAWGALYAIQADSKVSVTVFDPNLNAIYTYTINESTSCSQYLMLGNAVFDENNLYLASGLCPSGDSVWGIYSVKLVFQIRYNTVLQQTTITILTTIERTTTLTNTYIATVTSPSTTTLVQIKTFASVSTTTITLQKNFTKTINSVSEKTVTITNSLTITVEKTANQSTEKTITVTAPPSTVALTISQIYTYTTTLSKDHSLSITIITASSIMLAIVGSFVALIFKKKI